MRLLDFNPRWLAVSRDRHGMGVSFRCPHCSLLRLAVWFENPLDGMAAIDPTIHKGPLWSRSGQNFETLTLVPSIDAEEKDEESGVTVMHWHGFIHKGSLVQVH